jgi:hypothetical protein
MKIYFFNYSEQEIILQLLNYVSTNSDIKFSHEMLNLKNIDRIDNNSDNYILFSFFLSKNISVFDKTINAIREKFQKININIVVGGSFLNFLSIEDINKYYGEVNFICIGKGEEFLISLLSRKINPGIHFDKDFPLVKKYLIVKEEFLNKSNLAYLTINGNECKWGRCLFCKLKTEEKDSQRVNIEEIYDSILYYRKNKKLKLVICDSYNNIDEIKKITDMLHEDKIYDVDLIVFGVRADMDLNGVKDKSIFCINLGVEFYTQYLLDLYKKGITIEQIDKSINKLKFIAKELNAFLLFGVPGYNLTHFKDIKLFIEKYKNDIHKFNGSLFCLSDNIEMYKMLKEFRIEITGNYNISDFFKSENCPKINTKYLKFRIWDQDEKRMINNREILDKILRENLPFKLANQIRNL